ncbi:MAG: NADH-quinone oxidoreductase subunit NuoI [Campylobacter sp.]|jgi:NADH-quinone oxidoreductase subunit I|nr:NADH-quinone oxidoreductase subunit NuoI [Campylobacter sp.]
MSYFEIDKRVEAKTNSSKFKRFLKRTFSVELLVGLGHTFKQMVKKDTRHTLMYPFEKMELDLRYRGVHSLMRLLESGDDRCIGCGLCAKICPSNCIDMDTHLDENERKIVSNYSINLGRCVYCGLCADVCPELAIVHGREYELASEQRAYYAFKEDLLTKNVRDQVEFEGYGSLTKDVDERVKKTPTAYIKVDE